MNEFRDLFVDREAPSGRIVRAIASIGEVSATQLVKATGLARSTVSMALTELKERGIVLDAETRNAGFGRPTQFISLNPTTGFCAGVLLGLGEVRVALCDLAHNVVADLWSEMPYDYSPASAAALVRDQLDAECHKLGIGTSDLLGVGLAVSAPVSYDGRILNGSILPTWAGVDIAEVFSAEIDCPIFAENESHCGALAEMTWGAAIGEPNFALYKFDLGVGGAVVLNGAVHRGALGNAAEFGHVSLNSQGPLCRCGNRGCLEAYAAGFNLLRMVEQTTGEKISIDTLIDRTKNGDPTCLRFVEDAAEMAGWGMAVTSKILSPPLFIIAGKLAAIGEHFTRRLELSFVRHMQQPFAGSSQNELPRLAVGKFIANDDTVMGAVALVLHQHGRITQRHAEV